MGVTQAHLEKQGQPGTLTPDRFAPSVAGEGIMLDVTTNAIKVRLESPNPTLRYNGLALGVKYHAASFTQDANGLSLAAGVAGDGLVLAAGVLAVNPDGSTLEINADALRIKAAGVTESHLNASVAGAGLSGGAGTPLAVKLETTDPSLKIVADELGVKFHATSFTKDATNGLALNSAVAGAALTLTAGVLDVAVDGSTIEVSADALRVKAAGITESHLNASVAGDGLAGGAGTPLSVKVEAVTPTLKIVADELSVKFHSASFTQDANGLSLVAGVAGDGLALSAGVLSVNADNLTVELNADALRVKAGGIGYTHLATASVNLDGVSFGASGIDLIAGAGVSITPDNGAKTITIAASLNAVFSDKTKPTGLLNGTNRYYLLSGYPVDNSDHLYVNGFLQDSEGAVWNATVSSLTFANGSTTVQTSLGDASTEYAIGDVLRSAANDGLGVVTGVNAPSAGQVTLSAAYDGAAAGPATGFKADFGADADYVLSGRSAAFRNAPASGGKLRATFRV